MTPPNQKLLSPVYTFRLDGTPLSLPLPAEFVSSSDYEIEDEYGRIIKGSITKTEKFQLPRLNAGYHLLRLSVGKLNAETLLIVAPYKAYCPPVEYALDYAKPFNNFKTLRQHLTSEPLNSLHLTVPFPCAADLKAFYRLLFRQPPVEPTANFDEDLALYLALRAQYPVNQDYNDWANNCFDYNKITSFKTKEFAKKYSDKIALAGTALSEVERCLQEIAAFCRRRSGRVYAHVNLPLAVEYTDYVAWRDRKLLLPKNLTLPDSQNFVPYNPEALAKARCEPYIRLLRSNMSHADILCFDKPQFLAEQLCNDAPFSDKVLQYDLQALLAITAIESHRCRCQVIALDKETLSPVLREQFTSFGIKFILPE